MSGTIPDVTVTVEQGNALEAGEQYEGTITGGDVETFTSGGDEYTYFSLVIEENQTGMEFTPDWPLSVTPGTGLGRLVQRFGQDLQIGEDLSLDDVFKPGQQVVFETELEEGDDGEFLVIDEETVWPKGADVDDDLVVEDDEEAEETEDVDDSDDDDGDSEEEDGLPTESVKEKIAEMDSTEEDDVKMSLAQEDADHLKAYKQLKEDGEIEVEDGDVVPA